MIRITSNFWCVFAFLCFFVLASPSKADDFTHQETLDQVGSFQLAWKFDNETITFKYTVRTKGWAGLGFSPNGGMAGSDIVVVAIDQSGKRYISDRHGPQEKNGYPPEDKHQDYNLLSLDKNDTHMTTTFSRKRNTCDPDDMVLTDNTVRIIYAKSDAIPTDANNFEQHTSDKGTKSVLLFNNKKPSPDGVPPEPGATSLEIRANKVQVPGDKDTLYWCEIRKFEKSPKKTHIIKIEPLIENVAVVHHINVFTCTGEAKKYLNRGRDCFDDPGLNTDNITDVFGRCMNQLLTVWTKGGQSIIFPENLGMPLYNDDGETFLMLQMHYDNSEFLKGKVDSSGLRFWLTEHLRPTETAIAYFNAPIGGQYQIIPPNAQEFTTYVYCSADCTSTYPETGLKFISGMMHTHLAGRKVRLHHFRHGTQLPPIVADEYYDFNYQDYKELQKPVTILPGDELVVECVYKTLDRTKSTYGGYPTHKEMCYVFVQYYPVAYKGLQCSSYLPKDDLYKNLTKDDRIHDTTAFWTQDKIKEFQNMERNGMHIVQCSKPPTNGTQVELVSTTQYGYPNFTHPYIPPKDECKGDVTTPANAGAEERQVHASILIIFSFFVAYYFS